MSNGNNLNTIYDQVYEKLKVRYNNLFKDERGKFYNIIREILGESDPKVTQIICDAVNIKSKSYPRDDFKIVEELLSEVFTERQVTSNIVPQLKKLTNQVIVGLNNSNAEDSMKWLVVAACMLVGVYACLQYLEGRKKQDQRRRSQPQPSTPPETKPTSMPIPAGLCLVVPASSISSFQTGECLDGQSLTRLINSASYFLCKRLTEAKNLERSLEVTTEAIKDIPVDSPREVYVRVKIDNGKEMIDKTTRYEIKENIQDSEQYEIETIECLRTLSGLESFIRI